MKTFGDGVTLRIPPAVAAEMGMQTIARVMVDGKEYAASFRADGERVHVHTELGSRSVPMRRSMRPEELAQIIALQIIRSQAASFTPA